MIVSLYKQSNSSIVLNPWSLFDHKRSNKWSVDDAAVKLCTERKHSSIITSTNTDQQTRHTHVLTARENKEIFIECTQKTWDLVICRITGNGVWTNLFACLLGLIWWPSVSSLFSVAMQNRLVNTKSHCVSSPSPIRLSLNAGRGAPDEARLGPLLDMVHCHTKMELFVPVFSTLGIYRAAATDVLIKKAQTLMSNGLHTALDLTHTCSLTEPRGLSLASFIIIHYHSSRYSWDK